MENSGKNKSFLAIALALVALALGGASLFLSINSLEKLKQSESVLSEKSDKAYAAAVESKSQLVDSKKATAEIAKLKAEIESLKVAMKQNADATNKSMKVAFEHYSKPVVENRNLIIANQEEIKKIAERMSPVVSSTQAEESSASPQLQENPENPEYMIYVIKSGDYFSKLAKKFNVSVEAIEKANPNVSSTALQIGQKINIPQAK